MSLTSTSSLVTKYRINGMPKDSEYSGMPFGRQLDYRHKIQAFKDTAKSQHISIKRTSAKKAITEFVKLYEATEYYCQFHDSPGYRDDSFQIWYKAS